MRQLSWGQRAKRDLEKIQDFWLPEDPDFVGTLLTSILRSGRFLIETPGAGSPVDKSGLRKWRLGRTPYLIFYRVSKHEVRIVRVRHEHENWQPRP